MTEALPVHIPRIIVKWRDQEIEVPLDARHESRDLVVGFALEIVRATAGLAEARQLQEAASGQPDPTGLMNRANFEACDATLRLERAIAALERLPGGSGAR